MLLNGDNLVWIGKRRPKWADAGTASFWQMPQGGLEQDESPLDAAMRELREETGIRSAEVLAVMPEPLTYDLPEPLLGVALKGRYRGHCQRWFAMRFTGCDGEIDIQPKRGLKAEFIAWRWSPLGDLPDLVVAHKRALYETLLRDLAPAALQRRAGVPD